MKKPQVFGLVLAMAIVVAGKQYFREASADDLRWLLAPTAKCVSVLTGTHFVRESGAGYVDRSVSFEIAPVCSGLQFMLAAILALSIGWLSGMQSWKAAAKRVAVAVCVAYVATIVVNTLRIAIALRMHAHDLSGSELHRLEGVIVYLGGLCALFAMAKQLDDPNTRKTSHA
ncbi:MAG TPA: exosortase K [Kofleriaceae bacterium]|nr:exosortase K [Kofleriaceae bacterium]